MHVNQISKQDQKEKTEIFIKTTSASTISTFAPDSKSLDWLKTRIWATLCSIYHQYCNFSVFHVCSLSLVLSSTSVYSSCSMKNMTFFFIVGNEAKNISPVTFVKWHIQSDTFTIQGFKDFYGSRNSLSSSMSVHIFFFNSGMRKRGRGRSAVMVGLTLPGTFFENSIVTMAPM